MFCLTACGKECRIRARWNRRQRPGASLLRLDPFDVPRMMPALAILIGIPAGIAFSLGWLKNPSQHLAPLILGGIVLFFLFFGLVISFFAVMVLTKDFVVPQMALEDIGVIEGWRRSVGGHQGRQGRLRSLHRNEDSHGDRRRHGVRHDLDSCDLADRDSARCAGRDRGRHRQGCRISWNAYTITSSPVGRPSAWPFIFYVLALISVPAIVFFPAYSIHFFASRYRPLDAVLHPLAQAPPPLPPPIPPDPSPGA